MHSSLAACFAAGSAAENDCNPLAGTRASRLPTTVPLMAGRQCTASLAKTSSDLAVYSRKDLPYTWKLLPIKRPPRRFPVPSRYSYLHGVCSNLHGVFSPGLLGHAHAAQPRGCASELSRAHRISRVWSDQRGFRRMVSHVHASVKLR